MELQEIYRLFKQNLQVFEINTANIHERYRILVDEAVKNVTCEEVDFDEGAVISIGALRQRAWDIIHTGKWSEVALDDRYLYSLSTYLEILLQFREHLIAIRGMPPGKISQLFLEHTLEALDMGLLLGSPIINEHGDNILCIGASDISRYLSQLLGPDTFPENVIISGPDSIPGFERLSTTISDVNAAELNDKQFSQEFYDKSQPVVIRQSIIDWPATEKWKDVSYFQRNFGYRTVPIEIGSQYTTDDWGQELMLLKDFIEKQFNDTPSSVAYLAQHDLFGQIPQLKEDLHVPPLIYDVGIDKDLVDVKIWFGPGGTVSPLHYDKKENFLCQVIGWKKIILIRPDDADYLYPFDSEMLFNTSQLDLTKDLDLKRFPLAEKAKQFNVLLGPGDMLYIPYGWWHHVTSLSPSISVSFWWNRQ